MHYGCEVGVAKLEDFDNHDQSNDVPDGGNGQDWSFLTTKTLFIHECCVKLKVLIGGTDVVAGREDSLEYESAAHRVEKAKVVRDPTTESQKGRLEKYFGLITWNGAKFIKRI